MESPTAQTERRRTPGSADTWPSVLLLPAVLLLRYLGEHAWAYWTAVVIGVLALIGAAVEITGAVGHLVNGHAAVGRGLGPVRAGVSGAGPGAQAGRAVVTLRAA